MSLILSTQSEWLKTRRTAAFWLSLLGAAFVPTILMIALFTERPMGQTLTTDPWTLYFNMGWQILSVFLLPMYIILVSTLITQIEFKNNTWKQVFASPQSLGNIFFSKFLTIHGMILFCFLLFNFLIILSALIASLFVPHLGFVNHSIDWTRVLKLNTKTYISILGISAIQYVLALRFKNFIAPVGIGLALVICSIIALNVHWRHIYKLPYAYPILSYDSLKSGGSFLKNHEWNSIGYFVVVTLLGFLDMKTRKEKG